jgi:hypothetical protein
MGLGREVAGTLAALAASEEATAIGRAVAHAPGAARRVGRIEMAVAARAVPGRAGARDEEVAMRAKFMRWALPLVAMVALLAGGCAGGGANDSGATQSGGGSAAPAVEPGAPAPNEAGGGEVAKDAAGFAGSSAGADADRSTSAPAQSGGVKLVSLESRIIRNASVQLEIGRGRLDQTMQQANQIVARHQGIFAGSKTSAPEGGPAQGLVTFRVPNGQFEATMAELKRLGTYRGESSSSNDVTSEYVDTKSQLDAWRAQERVYLRLMSEAKTIGETLSVRARLDEVQNSINRLQGQLNVLEDQTSMATVNLELSEPGAAPAPEPSNPFAQAWRTGLAGLSLMLRSLIVGVMWLAPLAVLAALVVVVVRALRRPRPAAPAPQAEA